MRMKNKFLVILLVSFLAGCEKTSSTFTSYDCADGHGVLLSEKELRWGKLTFIYEMEDGVHRRYVYKDGATHILFNNALLTLSWYNTKNSTLIDTRKCRKQ